MKDIYRKIKAGQKKKSFQPVHGRWIRNPRLFCTNTKYLVPVQQLVSENLTLIKRLVVFWV
jgi:hypothetical protein